MTDLVLVVVLLLAGGAAAWLAADLRTIVGGATRSVPSLAVVVPARDEEATLPAVLDSLHGLGVDVVVVDDDSRDATASVARAAGARVLAAGTPPPGWTGKAWACHVGAEATTSDLLLFLDADTVLAPDALAGLVDLHDRHGGLVSVQPFHAVERPHEQVSAYFNVVAVLASGAFTRDGGRRPMAFGPCLLTSRADYERAGGHGSVRSAILDDVELAVAYHRAGLPVRCWVGGDRLRMRSYPGGLGQLVSGWTKNIASGASAAAPGPTLGTVLWISAHHAVAVGALLALVEAVTGWGAALSYGHPLVWAVAWVVAAGQLRSLLARVGSFRWWTWAVFPVPLLAFDLVFARSAAQTALRRSVRWRGRAVDLRHRSVEGGA
ncbi:4,4'-diaponeurosporenoate glycosyltransferase [Nocardioides aquaticus]|jgi:4,4'-diaponeurosporenoate glycosyltransferase|uniref:4,4'-diaponeurosporenoate glycosyltransferase n=1 Tax=Nocardioides aquaticus TaxID=160826 RepID=A0ABX8EJF5_9ACTN|nr:MULTISPECIES: glycosyltransferase [Nocardioides]QVT80652.1 4,4'-diaponeurosporenoate glycosyltransferase [Nocardioides aquaticus]